MAITWPSISVLVLLSQNNAGSQVGPFAIHRLNITCSFFGQLVLALSKNDLQALRVEATNWPNSASWWWFVQRFGRLFCLLCCVFYPSEIKWINSLHLDGFCWNKFYRSQTLKKNEQMKVSFFFVCFFFPRDQIESRIFQSLDELKVTPPFWRGWNNASWASISDRPWVSRYPLMERKNWMTTWSWQTLFVYILELIIGCFLFLCFFLESIGMMIYWLTLCLQKQIFEACSDWHLWFDFSKYGWVWMLEEYLGILYSLMLFLEFGLGWKDAVDT